MSSILSINTVSSIASQTKIPEVPQLFFYYIVLGICFWIMAYYNRKKEENVKRYFILISVFLISVSIAFAGILFSSTEKNSDLEVTMIDVQQGICLLIKLPDQDRIMIDCGNDTPKEQFDIGKRVVVPFLYYQNIKNIDTLILTHPDMDHMNGFFEVIQNTSVKEFWKTTKIPFNEEEKNLWALCDEKKIIKRTVIAPVRIRKGPVEIDILWPVSNKKCDFRKPINRQNSNENSMVLKIRYGTISFLITGDIGERTEKILVKEWGGYAEKYRFGSISSWK